MTASATIIFQLFLKRAIRRDIKRYSHRPRSRRRAPVEHGYRRLASFVPTDKRPRPGRLSNGAHATAALLDASDGEVARRFSAFLFVERGGRLAHYELLKDKLFLMESSNAQSRRRAQEICDAAKAAESRTTFIFHAGWKHGQIQ